jgi:hypothetical protein
MTNWLLIYVGWGLSTPSSLQSAPGGHYGRMVHRFMVNVTRGCVPAHPFLMAKAPDRGVSLVAQGRLRTVGRSRKDTLPG